MNDTTAQSVTDGATGQPERPRKKPLTGPRRDTQRSRVYTAENNAADRHGTFWTQTIPNADLQPWVDKVLDKRAVRSRWGTRHVEVGLKRGGRALSHGPTYITLPLGGRNPWVVLHEIAHCLTPDAYASHGPEFVGVFLFLVEAVIGKDEATTLRESFKAQRVRHNRKAIPAVKAEVPPAVIPARKAQEKAQERLNRQQADRRREVALQAARTPLTAREKVEAALLLRRAVASGTYGPSGSKPRTHALATARVLER